METWEHQGAGYRGEGLWGAGHQGAGQRGEGLGAAVGFRGHQAVELCRAHRQGEGLRDGGNSAMETGEKM